MSTGAASAVDLQGRKDHLNEYFDFRVKPGALHTGTLHPTAEHMDLPQRGLPQLDDAAAAI